jgi:hypothetical protein
MLFLAVVYLEHKLNYTQSKIQSIREFILIEIIFF